MPGSISLSTEVQFDVKQKEKLFYQNRSGHRRLLLARQPLEHLQQAW